MSIWFSFLSLFVPISGPIKFLLALLNYTLSECFLLLPGVHSPDAVDPVDHSHEVPQLPRESRPFPREPIIPQPAFSSTHPKPRTHSTFNMPPIQFHPQSACNPNPHQPYSGLVLQRTEAANIDSGAAGRYASNDLCSRLISFLDRSEERAANPSL